MSRDPVDWPFLASSIWNMPIGSGAEYADARINSTLTWPQPPQFGVWANCPGSDRAHIIMEPTAPLTAVKRCTVGWSGGNRCLFTAPETNYVSVPIPDAYTAPNTNANEVAVILGADGDTIYEMQPFARCTAAGYATSLQVTNGNYPDDPPYLPSLTGHGIHWGAHGGSHLSGFGCLREGELRPGGSPPHHVLGLVMELYEIGYKAPTQALSFRWPAHSSDGVWAQYGSVYNNTNPVVKMGSLLAIHKDADINAMGFETDPGLQLAWTLQNFGAYIMDNLGFSWNASNEFLTQFYADYPEFRTHEGNYTAFRQPYHQYSVNPWVRDNVRIYQNLWVIDNNTETSVGGGGVPRVDYAPLMEVA